MQAAPLRMTTARAHHPVRWDHRCCFHRLLVGGSNKCRRRHRQHGHRRRDLHDVVQRPDLGHIRRGLHRIPPAFVNHRLFRHCGVARQCFCRTRPRLRQLPPLQIVRDSQRHDGLRLVARASPNRVRVRHRAPPVDAASRIHRARPWQADCAKQSDGALAVGNVKRNVNRTT